MSKDDLTYFQRRAEAEVEQAQRATSLQVVAAHYTLANTYLKRLEDLEREQLSENA